ncbi:MAG: hypothetical protein NTW86_15665 [Candidatus Sumerlaeota bacterium]|nr:hypothetical protein [Candidatus Sumerlaeota bacterium]
MSNGNKEFYFILNAVKVLQNHDLFKGEVRLISVATTDIVPQGDVPVLKVETPLFKGVRSGDFLPLGTAGKLLYTSPERPKFLNWSMWVIEDDSDIRDTAKAIDEAMASDEFKGLETAVKAALASNPAALATEAIVVAAAKLIAKVAMKNKNDQIGVIDTTFVHKIHNIDDFAVSGEPCGDARLAYTLKYI